VPVTTDGPALDEDLRPTLGVRLRAVRVQARLSQRAVGRRLRRPHSLVSRWEAGVREPTAFDLVALARVVGVSPDELIRDVVPGPAGRRWSCRAYAWRLRAAFGHRLAAARLDARISRRDVLDATGIGGLRLACIEAGADPSVAEVIALRDLYGFALSEVVRDANLDSRRFLTMVPPTRLYPTSDPLFQRAVVDGTTPLRRVALAIEPEAGDGEPGASMQITALAGGSSGNRRVATVRAAIPADTRIERWADDHTAAGRPWTRRSATRSWSRAA
jgi:transcriptional regulator with XRE-family HTH domain